MWQNEHGKGNDVRLCHLRDSHPKESPHEEGKDVLPIKHTFYESSWSYNMSGNLKPKAKQTKVRDTVWFNPGTEKKDPHHYTAHEHDTLHTTPSVIRKKKSGLHYPTHSPSPNCSS